MKKVIIITGKQGSGKTTLAKEFRDKPNTLVFDDISQKKINELLSIFTKHSISKKLTLVFSTSETEFKTLNNISVIKTYNN